MDIKVGLIGGSGLGEALGAEVGTRHEVDTPFGKPSDAIVETIWGGMPVFALARHGAGHLLQPSMVPYRANIFAMKQLGVTHILASGAVGSLREEMRPRDLVIPDQVIDRTYRRAGTFYNCAAVHVEFAEPFCPVLRRILMESATPEVRATDGPGEEKQSLFKVHERGCYVCMEGAAFSTRAESLMHRMWGGDLIGMTAMPEAKLAREAEISYALVGLVTDYDCWRQKPAATEGKEEKPVDRHSLLQEIIGNLKAASENAVGLMRAAVEKMGSRREELERAPALKALELGIWSDKAKIPADEVQRLGPLWMKYFEKESGVVSSQ
jgi:5'-methylthioadenosine phosphorylase